MAADAQRALIALLLRHFPLVFNGPYAALRANDLPSIPSVAASMRTIIQNMTDKLRKKEAKRLYEVRCALQSSRVNGSLTNRLRCRPSLTGCETSRAARSKA